MFGTIVCVCMIIILIIYYTILTSFYCLCSSICEGSDSWLLEIGDQTRDIVMGQDRAFLVISKQVGRW